MATGKLHEAKPSAICCKCEFLWHSSPWDYFYRHDLYVPSLSSSGHTVQFDPVQFRNNCTIPAYGFCIVVGNSLH